MVWNIERSWFYKVGYETDDKKKIDKSIDFLSGGESLQARGAFKPKWVPGLKQGGKCEMFLTYFSKF